MCDTDVDDVAAQRRAPGGTRCRYIRFRRALACLGDQQPYATMPMQKPCQG